MQNSDKILIKFLGLVGISGLTASAGLTLFELDDIFNTLKIIILVVALIILAIMLILILVTNKKNKKALNSYVKKNNTNILSDTMDSLK